ncbi:MAG: hypothetical protein ACAI34_08860 [Verrucomicrobium sp.]|nr:hypothetical protein [Verrucomicrobium sp.]
MSLLPKNFLTWLMLLLLVILVGIASWMYWALGKVEGAKGKRGGVPAEVQGSATGQDRG